MRDRRIWNRRRRNGFLIQVDILPELCLDAPNPRVLPRQGQPNRDILTAEISRIERRRVSPGQGRKSTGRRQGLAHGHARAERLLARAGHVAGDEDRPILHDRRRDLVAFEHPRELPAVRCPDAKYLAGHGGLNFGSDLGKFDAFDHERADDRERDAAVELDRGTLSQLGNAGHRDFDNVSALQAVFRSRRVQRTAQRGREQAGREGNYRASEAHHSQKKIMDHMSGSNDFTLLKLNHAEYYF